MIKKLSSNHGFSLTELLVALMIVMLVTLTVAVGVPAGFRMFDTLTTGSQAQSLCGTLVIELSDELRFAQDIEEDNSGDVTFTSYRFGPGVSIENNADGHEGHVTIGNATTGYKPILSEKSYTGLNAAVEIKYSDDLFKVEISIPKGINDEKWATAEFNVAPIN